MWEHKVLHYNCRVSLGDDRTNPYTWEQMRDDMNELGSEGWELVSFNERENSLEFIATFKRFTSGPHDE